MPETFRPLFDRVAVKELEEPAMRKSGLVVPVKKLDTNPPQNGIVISVGPGLDWWEHNGIEMPVKPGDHIMFPYHSGTWIDVEEERLLVLRVGEILGVLETVTPGLAETHL